MRAKKVVEGGTACHSMDDLDGWTKTYRYVKTWNVKKEIFGIIV